MFVKRNITEDTHVRAEYPRHDLGPVIGLGEEYKYYYTEVEARPTYNQDFENLVLIEEFIDEPWKNLPHIGIFKKRYEIVQKDINDCIKVLNDSLGNHLDTAYPFWERIKFDTEGTQLEFRRTASLLGLLGIESLSAEEETRLDYLISIKNWVAECRALRDTKEQELINGTFPFLTWPERPTKVI